MRVGIDIDGTLTTMDIIVDVFNRETGKNLTTDDLIVYDVGDCYGLSKDEAVNIWVEHSEEIFKRHLSIWDIEEFMYMWENYKTVGKKEKNEIIIVTAREERFRKVTENWLRMNGIRYDELHMGYDKKINAVREHFLDVMVDDKAVNIRDIDRESYLGCEAFVVDRPYNKWYGTKNRVYVMDIPSKV